MGARTYQYSDLRETQKTCLIFISRTPRPSSTVPLQYLYVEHSDFLFYRILHTSQRKHNICISDYKHLSLQIEFKANE